MQQNPIRITLALLTLLPAAIAAKRVMTPIDVQPESKLWVSGTSTVRSFECQAGSFDAKLASTGTDAVAAVLAGEKAVSDVVVTVPVDKLDCRNGTMNEHLRKALKATQHPTVVFRVSAYELARSTDGVAVTLTGTLTLGGVEKLITVNAQAKPGENGTLLVSGTREVRMTEFGLKPPTLMLGTLKVDERIKVGFDVVLKD
jgi:polyisoprenoid-binding protein YceI